MNVFAPQATAQAAIDRLTEIYEASVASFPWSAFLGLGIGLAACSAAQAPTASSSDGGASGNSADDGQVKSFAHVDEQGQILGVGVVVPVKSFETVPDMDPAFQNAVGVEMPATVRDKTFIQLLRINWLAAGHGPGPYHAPHFDLHFYRGTMAEVTAITCPATDPFPANILASGYETPSTCVGGMGYHAWPSTDIESNTFSASIILGYAAQKMVFIEPMITQEVLLSRKSFELAITRPESAGGAATLFPSHLTVTYAAATDTYEIEFDHFEPID